MILLQAFPAAPSTVVFRQRFSFPTGTGQRPNDHVPHHAAGQSSDPECAPAALPPARPPAPHDISYHAAPEPPSAPSSSGDWLGSCHIPPPPRITITSRVSGRPAAASCLPPALPVAVALHWLAPTPTPIRSILLRFWLVAVRP